MKKQVSILRLIGVNLVVLFCLLLVVEVIFGRWVFGPQFGVLNLPRNTNRTFDTSKLYAGGGVISYRRDKYGLRGSYENLSEVDLLVLGGSTTNELYVDDNATWSSVIAERARVAGVPKVVVNAGVDGQSTIGHLHNFEVWFPQLPEFKPRIILAYIGINDIVAEEQAKFDEMKSPDAATRVRYFLLNHSALYDLYRTGRGMHRARSAKLVHGDLRADTKQWEPVAVFPDKSLLEKRYRQRLVAYSNRVSLLIERIRDLGAHPVIVTQQRGTYRLIDGRVYVRRKGEAGLDGGYVLMSLFNEVAMEACHRASAKCIDLASELQFADGDFYDAVHTTPQGSRRIGDYLYSKLSDIL